MSVVPVEMAPGEAAGDMMADLHAHQVTAAAEIHEINGRPRPEIAEEHVTHITPLVEQFIASSPFFLIATANGIGQCDVSPKGDTPGVVKVLNPTTIAIPDRLGNKRADGHRNILENGHVGLLFMVPNVDETLRINGRCFITTAPALLESMALEGRAPKLAMIVEVDEVFMHCARSFLRSGLWNPETWPNAEDIPTMRAINCEQREMPLPDPSEDQRNEEYRSRLF